MVELLLVQVDDPLEQANSNTHQREQNEQQSDRITGNCRCSCRHPCDGFGDDAADVGEKCSHVVNLLLVQIDDPLEQADTDTHQREQDEQQSDAVGSNRSCCGTHPANSSSNDAGNAGEQGCDGDGFHDFTPFEVKR